MPATTEGVLAGYRVVDLKIDFYDGKMHPVDSKDIAFQIAGKEAFREAFLKARPCLLEPKKGCCGSGRCKSLGF